MVLSTLPEAGGGQRSARFLARGGRPKPPRRPGAFEPVRGLRLPWWFVLPALVCYLLIAIYPNVQAFTFSFTDWNGLPGTPNYIGLDNYRNTLDHPQFWPSVSRTLQYTVVVSLAQVVFGLGLALALHNRRIRTRNALRTVFFAPVALTVVAVGYIWQYIYTPNGALNYTLSAVGLDSWRHDWLGDPTVNIYAISFIYVWQTAGMAMVIFLAGLESIDPNYLEAASIDGASAVQRFFHITMPLLTPAFIINVLGALIGGLTIFTQVWVATRGGPAYTTTSLATLSYSDGFLLGKYSFAITIAIVLSVIVGTFAALQLRMMANRAVQ